MIAFFLFTLIVLEGLAALAFLLCYKFTKEHHVVLLGAWFATRFLSLVLAGIADRFLNWSPLPVNNISVFIEGIVMVYFYYSIDKKATKSVKVFILLFSLIFLSELFLAQSLSEPFYVLNTIYYLLVCIMLLGLILKVKPAGKLHLYLQILFVFHAVVMIYMLNATLFLFNKEVFNLVYPVLWLCTATLDILSIIFVLSEVQKKRYYLN